VTRRGGLPALAIRVVVLLVAVATASSACSDTDRSAITTSATTSTRRSAEKTTCEEIVPGWIPVGIELADRRLVPFSDTLLGVDAEYLGDDVFLQFVSGGYLDDLLEPYDDLALLNTTRAGGEPADLLGGSFVGSPVFVVTWRASDLDPPCSTRAVVAVGLDQSDFEEIVDRIMVLAP